MVQVTRRGLFAGAAALPIAVASAPVRAGGPSAFDRALDAYLGARRRHEVFLAEVLDPAVRRARSVGQGLTGEIRELEDRANDLCASRYDALGMLVDVPSGSLADLRTKVLLAHEDVLRFEDGNGHVRAIVADLERLLE